MSKHKAHKPSFRIWLEYEGRPVLGKGGAQILQQINIEESISKTAEKLGMSYRYVWGYLRKIEKTLGEPIIATHRGGKSGGGGARLTKLGRSLLDEFARAEGCMRAALSGKEDWEVDKLTISARNRLKGRVISVEKGDVAAVLKVEIGTPVTVTALITRELMDERNIKVGDEVEAVIKATEVRVST